ncbi:endolytic transglycosylase MltG [Peptococcaceae bacterium]|nr:endolytic transglycosylase MltG [Peptococcaceae bacterium]
MLVSTFLLVALLIFFGLFYFLSQLKAVNSEENMKIIIVEVEPNTACKELANMLEKKGLIRNSFVFNLYATYTGMDTRIQPGEYELNTAMSAKEILRKLVSGEIIYYSFTIPEGYTVEQIAEILEKEGLSDKERFLELCRQGDFDFDFLVKDTDMKYVLEGYLFPDTYKVTGHTTEEEIIEMMLKRFELEMEMLDFEQKAKELGLSVHQAVTIASMIEREALVDSDRPIISSVIHNRLKINMPLQIDATVLYALGEHKEVVLYKDLEVESPYNTYKVNSLPPGPIASPGTASLHAAVNPAKTDYLYYVLKPDGSHAFSRTYSEHLANVSKYL